MPHGTRNLRSSPVFFFFPESIDVAPGAHALKIAALIYARAWRCATGVAASEDCAHP